MILLGEEYKEILDSIGILARPYLLEGQWEEAEQLFVYVIETNKTKFGEGLSRHPNEYGQPSVDVPTPGPVGEAEQLEVQVMETRKTKLGEDHPSTLISMANLAFTWKSSGHTTQALDLLRNCVIRQKKIQGLNHHLTLSTSENLLKWELEKSNTNTSRSHILKYSTSGNWCHHLHSLRLFLEP